MEPSLRLIPAATSKSASVASTASGLGLHNTLEYGPRTIAAEVQSSNGFKERLENWEETQDNLKLSMQRNMYGLHMPMRLLMERRIVAEDPHMPAFGQSNIHLDILMGRDDSISPADVLGGALDTTMGPTSNFHREMERKVKLVE